MQVTIRLPKEYLDELDKLAKKLSRPGLRVTRVEALRSVIAKGLGAK